MPPLLAPLTLCLLLPLTSTSTSMPRRRRAGKGTGTGAGAPLRRRLSIRGGCYGTPVPQGMRGLESERRFKLQMRDKERAMYAEPMGHIGQLLDKKGLPESDQMNPCVELKFACKGQPLGACTVELFRGKAPREADFVLRKLERFKLARLRTNMLLEISNEDLKTPMPTHEDSNLDHSEPYLLTMSRKSPTVLFRLCSMRTYSMDRTYQVVGRILKGIDIFDTMWGLWTTNDPGDELDWRYPGDTVDGTVERATHPLVELLDSKAGRNGTRPFDGPAEGKPTDERELKKARLMQAKDELEAEDEEIVQPFQLESDSSTSSSASTSPPPSHRNPSNDTNTNSTDSIDQ